MDEVYIRLDYRATIIHPVDPEWKYLKYTLNKL